MWPFTKKQSKKTWIGSSPANYSADGYKWEFWYQLYVDEDGNKSCDFTGKWPSTDGPKAHHRYSKVIIPWLNTKDDDQYDVNLWACLEHCNDDYWSKYPHITAVCHLGHSNNAEPRKAAPKKDPPKPKPEFKLLKFEPKKEVTNGDK